MLDQTDTYHPRVKHSLTYYHAVLLALIEGISCHLSDRQMAELLTGKGLRAPSGKPWTATAVKSALFKLRHHRLHPNRLHQAAVQLVFDRVLQPSQLWTLFGVRSRAM